MDYLNGAYDDEDAVYAHDDSGQVTGVDRDGTGPVLDESYGYDDNGNRTGAQTINGTSQTYASAGTNNQVLNDGKYAYILGTRPIGSRRIVGKRPVNRILHDMLVWDLFYHNESQELIHVPTQGAAGCGEGSSLA